MKLKRKPGESDADYQQRQALEDARVAAEIAPAIRSRVIGTVYRAAELPPDAVIDADERLVKISFSSEAPVLRQSWWSDPWVEVLGHGDGEMNTERLDASATVHYNHRRTRDDRIGVVESASVVNSRGEAVIRFSKHKRVNDVWEDVRDGVLRNVSVGYQINERTLETHHEDAPDEYRVTRWTPMEISFVDIPADHTVGLGRSVEQLNYKGPDEPEYRIEPIDPTPSQVNQDNDPMKLKRKTGESDADYQQRQAREDARVAAEIAARDNPPANDPPADPPADPLDAEALRAQGAADERARVASIDQALAPFERTLGERFVAVRDHCRTTGLTLEQSREYILGELGRDQTPVGADTSRISVIETSVEAFSRGASAALELRSGMLQYGTPEYDEVKRDAVVGYSLFEMARRMLELSGVATGRLSKMDLVARAFTGSDFPLLLVDAANKMMLKGFEEAPETWQMWAQTGNLSDFKIGNRPGLSSFSDLKLVSENGEFQYGTFNEYGQTIQLGTYGLLFSITRQAIIDDDLDSFTTIPAKMGKAASRLVGNLAYGAITSNPEFNDGIPFFDAGHANLNAGGASKITLDSVAAARNAMGLQTDANESAVGLNIQPSFLITPLALQDAAKQLMMSQADPRAPNALVHNTVMNLATVVTDPRLDSDSTTRWYLAASQMYDTIEVAFLDGIQAPTLEQQMGWQIDGSEFKVRLDVGVSPLEFRTWQRNDGA